MRSPPELHTGTENGAKKPFFAQTILKTRAPIEESDMTHNLTDSTANGQ